MVSSNYADRSFADRAYEAGFNRSDAIVKALEEQYGETFDFRTPDRAPGVPRNIAQLKYAELRDAIKHMYFPEEVIVTTTVQVPFDLPDDVVFAPGALQALMVACQKAQEEGLPAPDWRDFVSSGSEYDAPAEAPVEAPAETEAVPTT